MAKRRKQRKKQPPEVVAPPPIEEDEEHRAALIEAITRVYQIKGYRRLCDKPFCNYSIEALERHLANIMEDKHEWMKS